MLNTAGLLMSWLTGKRASILPISLCSLQGWIICSLLSSQSPVQYTAHGNMHLTFTRSSHFIPCAQTVSCPAVTSLLSLLLFCTPFLLHSFCTVPQGPPGPQGSPHPQPPPPNSMMGPHAQVTLHLSLSSSISLFFYFYLCIYMGTLVLSAGASCFGIHRSSVLCLVFSIRTNLPLNLCMFIEQNLMEPRCFLSQSFMSPRFAGGPRGPPIRMASQVWVVSMYTPQAHHVMFM